MGGQAGLEQTFLERARKLVLIQVFQQLTLALVYFISIPCEIGRFYTGALH